MATNFNRLIWVNGNPPSINESNLNRIEEYLSNIAEGGSGSVALADIAKNLDVSSLPSMENIPSFDTDYLTILDSIDGVLKKIPVGSLFSEDSDLVLGGSLTVQDHIKTRAQATPTPFTQIPVFIANPESTERRVYTRTPAELLSDIGASPSGHTHTFASLTSKPTTLSGYGITDGALSNHTHTFASLTSKPTTLSGYGITDGALSNHTHTSLGNITLGNTSANALGVNGTDMSTTGRGVSLYGGANTGAPSYGLHFSQTGTFGNHGSVQGDWATYFTMAGATNRGWIFRLGSTRVASISGTGNMALSGSLSAGSASFSTLSVDSDIEFNSLSIVNDFTLGGTAYIGNGAIGLGATDTLVTDEINGNLKVNGNLEVTGMLTGKGGLRHKHYSGIFSTTSNGADIPEMTVSFYAEAGEIVCYRGVVAGRPNAAGHVYIILRLDGSDVNYNAADGNTTWVRDVSLMHTFVAPTSKTYTYTARAGIGSGATTFGNNNRNCHYLVTIGGTLA